MKSIRFDLLLWLWSLAAMCAATAHIVLPGWTAAGTTWLASAHWQREIAYFDLLLATLFIGAARQPDLAIKYKLTCLLGVLSVLLGENHLEGWLQEAKVFHVIFAVANVLAAWWAGWACWGYRASRAGMASQAWRQPLPPVSPD